MTKWVCPYLLNILFLYNSSVQGAVTWLGREGKQWGRQYGMGWFPNCASPNPRIPRGRRAVKTGSTVRKG